MLLQSVFCSRLCLKSPKDKSAKIGKQQHDRTGHSPTPLQPVSLDSGHVKPYEYTTQADNEVVARQSNRKPGGFRYDEKLDTSKNEDDDPTSTVGQLSPSSQARRLTGLAFNYAPDADADKLRQHAGQLSPKSKRDNREIDASTSDPNAFIARERAHADNTADIKPRLKRIKLLVVISRYDNKTRRCDVDGGESVLAEGVLDTTNGTIDTPYGVVDPRTGVVKRLDPQTGANVTVQGSVDSKTGNVHVPSAEGNGTMGHVICFGDADKTAVVITAITGQVDAQTGRVNVANGNTEHSTGWLYPADGKIDTKYGQIDSISGRMRALDLKSGKAGQTLQNAKYDVRTGTVTIIGVVDPKTGKQDNQMGKLISIGQPMNACVNVVSVTGKPDKRGILLPESVKVRRTIGLIKTLPNNQRIVDSKFGQINLVKHTITVTDPRTGKSEVRDFKIDPATGQLVVRGAINQKTGRFDKDLVQILSVGAIENGKPPTSDGDADAVIVDVKTNQVWLPSGNSTVDNKPIRYYSTAVVDPKTGHITTVRGCADSDSNEMQRVTHTDPAVILLDESSGLVFTATGEKDADAQPLFATSIPDTETGSLLVKTAKRNAVTGKLCIVLVTPIVETQQQLETSTSSIALPTAKPLGTDQLIVQQPQTSTSVVKDKVAGADDAFIPVTESATENLIRNPVLDVLAIIGTIDSKSNLIDQRSARVERTCGILNTNNGFISTKYGQLHPITGECRQIDVHSGAVVTVKKAHVDPFTGQITIKGVVDSETGKLDQQLTQQVTFGAPIDRPVVEVASLSGRFDTRRGIIEPKTALLERTLGELNRDTGTLNTTYGELNLSKRTVNVRNPRTGIVEERPLLVDSATGQLLLRSNIVNPKTNRVDKDFARILSVRIVPQQLDAQTGREANVHTDGGEVIVDPITNRMWLQAGQDLVTGCQQYSASQVDTATGHIITIYGVLNPKTNNIEPLSTGQGIKTISSTAAPGALRIDPISGQVFTATGERDESSGEPLFAVSQIDSETGEMYTKVGRIDARTGKLVLVRILLVTRHDRQTGRPQVVDPNACDVDAVTGRVRNIFNKTVYVYNMVDPVTGEIVQVDPNDPRMAGARTTVTQTMTLSGEIDETTGRIKTEYGHIHPETGDIDPATAVRDPVTGMLILNYAQINPSHFGKTVTVHKETVPISRDQFFDGIKHLGKGALRRDSEVTLDEDVPSHGTTSGERGSASIAGGRYATAPTVVKTTTKQVLTKNDEGVTHNVEEEIRNLGTGEVVFSTQEHKVCVATNIVLRISPKLLNLIPNHSTLP